MDPRQNSRVDMYIVYCIVYSTVVHSSGTVLQKLTRGRPPPPPPHLGGHGDEYGMAQVNHHVSAED